MANTPAEEVKAQLKPEITESFLEITASLPAPGELRQAFTEGGPAGEMALDILSQTNVIKLSYVGVIVMLSLLIFMYRLPRWRGFRWLSTVLFIAGSINIFVSAALHLSTSVFSPLIGDVPAGGLLVNTMLPVFSLGVYIRTGIILVSAIALLAIYLVIKKRWLKKLCY